MTLDIILLALLALATIAGWRSGAIAMVLSVAVLVAAGIGAMLLALPVGEAFRIGPGWVHPIIGFLFSFIVLMIAGSWVKHFFTPKHGILRKFDGALGALLGFIRGALILSLLMGVFKLMHFPPERTTQRSSVYSVLIETSGFFFRVLRPYIHISSSREQITVYIHLVRSYKF